MTQYDIDEARTLLANCEEPNTAEEWEEFDNKLFFDYFSREDIAEYEKRDDTAAIAYLCKNLPDDAKMLDAYMMLDDLEDKVAEENEKRKEYLLRKERVCTLDKEEMVELLSL